MILFFHGADTFRSRQKLREVLEKFRRDVDPQGYNMTKLHGSDCSVQQIIGSLTAAPFMARKRLVLVEGLSEMDMSDDEEENLSQAAEAALDADVVFIVWEAALTKTQLKGLVFDTLKLSPYTTEFAALDQAQIGSWMRQRLQQAGIQLDNAAWAHLSLAVEDDLYRASSETDKIIAYAQAFGKNTLALADVKVFVAGGLRDDVFALVDTVTQGRPKDSLALLHDQIQSGSHPLELNSLLFRQYRLLQQVMDGQNQGLTSEKIASLYKMHPFVAKKLSGQSRRMQAHQIRRAYDTLVRLDSDIKGSGLPPDVLISLAVAKLAVQ